MSIKELTPDEIENLVGARHPTTGIEYPPNGLQPYYQWLIRALHLLAESSFGALRVWQDDATPASVFVAPGRASISDVSVEYTGGTLDLSAYNNDTANVWLYELAGTAQIGVADDASGWPGTAHVKLASIVIAAGEITQIIDRRIEHVLSA